LIGNLCLRSSEKDEAADDHVDAAQKEADNSSVKRESIPSVQSEKNLISDEEFSRYVYIDRRYMLN